MMSSTDAVAVIVYDDLPPIKETIGSTGWRARRFVGRSLRSALAMSIATGATMMLGSKLRSGSPWSGLNTMSGALRLGPKKAKKRFDVRATMAGAGVLLAGFAVLAGLYRAAR